MLELNSACLLILNGDLPSFFSVLFVLAWGLCPEILSMFKGACKVKFILQKVSHQYIVCFLDRSVVFYLAVSHWGTRQGTSWPFSLASGVDYISLKKYKHWDSMWVTAFILLHCTVADHKNAEHAETLHCVQQPPPSCILRSNLLVQQKHTSLICRATKVPWVQNSLLKSQFLPH